MRRSVAVGGLAALTALAGSLAFAPGAAAAAAARHHFEATAEAAPSPSLPTDTQQQLEADRPIQVPDTRSCTVTVMVHDFASSYGAPFTGTYTPPAGCPGPWSKVVLTLTSEVGGVQFDRDVYVAIGHAVMLDGSTSEPCCTGNDVTWTVQRDVTEYSALLAAAQPVIVELDNVTDTTYTGVYHTTVDLTFYETGASAPAPETPDFVAPVSSNSAAGPMLGIGKPDDHPGADVVFPRNLERLQAELFADAHGPCEEFWWSDPTNCAGTPYREVAVYIDGQLAGAAPTYPVTYTGADGPGLWEPIPSPRAWNLRPYLVDLTPFVGELTDGNPHRISLGILDASLASGDFWQTAANLFGWTQPGVTVTTGGVTAVVAPASPTETPKWDPSGAVHYTDTASHRLVFAGYLDTPSGIVTTRVTDVMGETDSQTQATDHGNWTWTQTVTTDSGGHETTRTVTDTYSMFTTALTDFQFTDNEATSTTTDGVATGWSTTRERMSTRDATGIAYNGLEQERYGYSDSSGACYDHLIASQAGEVTVDQLDAACPGSSALPVPSVPEAPRVWLLALLAVIVAGTSAWLVRRRAAAI